MPIGWSRGHAERVRRFWEWCQPCTYWRHTKCSPDKVSRETLVYRRLGDGDGVLPRVSIILARPHIRTHVIDGEVQVSNIQSLAIQQRPFLASIRPARRLQVHHLLQHGILVLVQEARQLGSIDRRVQLQERPHRRCRKRSLDAGEEDIGVSRVRIDRRFLGGPCLQVVLVLVRRCDRGEELGRGGEEEVAVDGEGVFAAALHGRQLFAVLFTHGRHGAFVHRSGGKGGRDGEECVHSVTLTRDLQGISVRLTEDPCYSPIHIGTTACGRTSFG